MVHPDDWVRHKWLFNSKKYKHHYGESCSVEFGILDLIFMALCSISYKCYSSFKMTLSQGLDRNKTQHLSHESVQGQAWVQHLSQEHDSHQCATWGHPWHLLSSPSPNPSVCPPWKEDQLSATTWRNKWDKWPARTTGLPGQMTITVTIAVVDSVWAKS